VTKRQKTWLLLGGATVLYIAVRRTADQQTAAQIIAQAKEDLKPLGRPIATS
jgi:hypothetical protein